MIRHIASLLIAVLVSYATAGCAESKTSIPLTWRNPGFEDVVFRKVFVIGVSQDASTRRLFEDRFVQALQTRGAEAQPSWVQLPQSEQLSKEQIGAAVDGGSFDGILITRLLGVEREQEYVPPKSYTVPTTHYGYGYYGYYGTSYATVHEPGYFKTETTFRLETNLYSVATGGLVWSGQSETVNPDSIAEVIDSMTSAVAERLEQEKLIP